MSKISRGVSSSRLVTGGRVKVLRESGNDAIPFNLADFFVSRIKTLISFEDDERMRSLYLLPILRNS